MKLKSIYIISYFGSDEKLQARRREIHARQLKWARAQKLEIVVLCQKYLPSDYASDVRYIESGTDSLLLPGDARNLLLEDFYKSKDDFAVFADNDTILYEDEAHGFAPNFVAELKSAELSDFSAIDLICCIYPQRSPFNAEIAKLEYEKNLIFKRTPTMKGSMFFLKNLRLHQSKSIFFDQASFVEEGKMFDGEDAEFCTNLLASGLGCYATYCAIAAEMAVTASTWVSEISNRDKFSLFKIINKKYGTLYHFTEEYKEYVSVGYSHKVKLKLCASSYTGRAKALKSAGHTNVVLYDLPYGMTYNNTLLYARDNIEDLVLQNLAIAQLKKPNKKFSHHKTKSNWTRYRIPAKICIKKVEYKDAGLFK